MIRVSEMVLAGHPDKFCDAVADNIVAACHAADPEAYCQVEVGVWGDKVWLSGGTMTRRPLGRRLTDLVQECALDGRRYDVTSTVCTEVGDPLRWSRQVNDQAIVIGYAAYDRLTRYLPPEHFLAHTFRKALAGQGPDGKLLVRICEDATGWRVEHVLVTVQQARDAKFGDVCAGIAQALQIAYEGLRARDLRWVGPWREVELLLNPNGPLLNGGSEGDNGQTGRKLVMDYYGPRVPLGGGALSGKHMSHIDRIAAYAARHAAVKAVASGARDCLVRLAYAPNQAEPLDVDWQMTGRGERQTAGFFAHGEMARRYPGDLIDRELARGEHFFDPDLPWNCEVAAIWSGLS